MEFWIDCNLYFVTTSIDTIVDASIETIVDTSIGNTISVETSVKVFDESNDHITIATIWNPVIDALVISTPMVNELGKSSPTVIDHYNNNI